MQCKYRDIREIIDWFDEYASDEMRELKDKQVNGDVIAWFAPAQANWAYKIELVEYNDIIYKAVTVFGQIKAVKPAYIAEVK